MQNLPKGFYYNAQGALINSNRSKTKLEKKVETLEKEVKDLKEKLQWILNNYRP